MPKLLFARPAQDATEERQVRKLASSRHAPGDWIRRAVMVVLSWQGLRTTAIAAQLHCHPQTVRERLTAFNIRGLDGLGDRPGAGRKRRITETERSTLVALVATTPPGRLVRHSDGSLGPQDPRVAQRDHVDDWKARGQLLTLSGSLCYTSLAFVVSFRGKEAVHVMRDIWIMCSLDAASGSVLQSKERF